jgi:hypothetical protein
MLPEQRAELERRRAELHERLRERHAEATLHRFTRPLEEAGVNYALAETESAIAWARARFPVACNRVDWEQVPERRCVSEEEMGPEAEWLAELARAEALGDSDVVVIFADWGRPSVRLRYTELLKHLDLLVLCAWDTWVFDEQSDWIIEYYHHGEWC